MRAYKHNFIVLAFLLAFASAACSNGDGTVVMAVHRATDIPRPTATPRPTDTPQPTPTLPPTADTNRLDPHILTLAENLARFNSYRFKIDMTFNGTTPAGAATTANMHAAIANITEPPAASLTITANGVEQFEELNSLAVTQKGGTSYISLPGAGCLTSPAEEDVMEQLGANFLDTIQFDEALEQARLIGQENVNGIPALHYEVDSSLINENDQFEEVYGDLYIAQDGGYLVRMVLNGEGEIDFLRDSRNTYTEMHVEYNLTDTNQPITIPLPPGCEETAAGGGSNFPITEDAFDVASIPGFTSYKTEKALADVVDFYEAALPGAGWAKSGSDSFESEDTAVLIYTRGQEKLNITIGKEDDDTRFVLVASE